MNIMLAIEANLVGIEFSHCTKLCRHNLELALHGSSPDKVLYSSAVKSSAPVA